MDKHFYLVVIGQIISLFGNALIRFALPLYILDQSGSAALFGAVSAASFLPMIVMSLVGGIIADRVNKQRIMVFLDFLTCALLMAFLLLTGRVDTVALVVVVLMGLYAIQGAYSPAVQASIPLLLPPSEILRGNAIINLVNSFSGLLGPVVGGMLYGLYGLTPIVAICCGCFFASAVMELAIRIPHIQQPTGGSMLGRIKADVAKSAHFVAREAPIMLRAFGIVFAFNVTYSALLMIALPVLITQTLNMGSELYGITQGAVAFGALVGGVMAGVMAKKITMRSSHHVLGLCAACLVFMVIVLAADAPAMVAYVVITAASWLAMALATFFSVQALAYVQTETPPEIVGKVISMALAISMCAQPIGQALYGLLFERMVGREWMIVLGSAVASMVIAWLSRRTFSQMDDRH